MPLHLATLQPPGWMKEILIEVILNLEPPLGLGSLDSSGVVLDCPPSLHPSQTMLFALLARILILIGPSSGMSLAVLALLGSAVR